MQNYTNNFVLRANEQRKSGKMETLKEKEWLFINDLIKKLYEQKKYAGSWRYVSSVDQKAY